MGAREYWDRMLVYFGITDEPEHAETGRVATRRQDEDEWSEPVRPQRSRRSSGGAASRPPAQVAAGVAVVLPKMFNDAQSIADRLKGGAPVIVNLQQTDSDLAKRLIDFASGLTYGLDGGMQRIADRVFLLTPSNVEVSAEERAAMVESGFFNQS